MRYSIIPLIVLVSICLGCAGTLPPGASVREGRELRSTVNVTKLPVEVVNVGPKNDLVFDPFDARDVTAALPDLGDLPNPGFLKKKRLMGQQQYTGVIKNKTQYEVTVPAGNSSATLTIPAHGFIEYTSWAPHFNLTAYHEGKPFYCMQINANPKNYPYMCKKYDFMIEIVKAKPIKKKYRKRWKKRRGGVEAYG